MNPIHRLIPRQVSAIARLVGATPVAVGAIFRPAGRSGNGIRRSMGIVGIAAAAALVGCGGEILVGDVWRAGTPEEFAAAAGGRDMATVIIGNPFDQAKDAVDAAITGAMQGHNYGPPTNFTTRPGPSAAPAYRITILFNPPPAIGPNSMCGDTGGLRAEDRGARLRLLAVFCSHGDPMSYVYASTVAAPSVDDQVVRHLMVSVTRELVPPVDPLLPGTLFTP